MQEFLAVAGVHFLAVSAPGQDFAWVSRQSLKNGRGYGLVAAAGIGCGVFVFCLVSIFGLEIVLAHFPHLIDVLKLAGAGYLFWIGWQMKNAGPGQDVASEEMDRAGFVMVFVRSCLVNLSNIKAIIFFLMVFSTLVSPETLTGTRVFYAVWMWAVTFVWFALVACFFGNSLIRQKFSRHLRKIELGTGGFFMLLAVLIVFDAARTL